MLPKPIRTNLFMKKTLLSLALIGITYCANAQVGVGTNTPQSTLDIVGKPTDTATPDGVIAPRVSVANLDAKNAAYTTAQTGAIVYVNDISAGSTVTATAAINAVGYYYFDGTKWVKFTPAAAVQDLRFVGTNNHVTQDAGVGGAGTSLGTGSDNIAIGKGASKSITNVSGTIAIGANALAANTTGSSITAIGNNALSSNTTSSSNTAVGTDALKLNTTGSSNTALGYNTLTSNVLSSANVAIGAGVLSSFVEPGFGGNIALGYQSADVLQTGNQNIVIGTRAFHDTKAGSENIIIGSDAYRYAVASATPNSNTIIGRSAAQSLPSGNLNTVIGYHALDVYYPNTNTVALGYGAGSGAPAITSLITSDNTFIGTQARIEENITSGTISYATAIGSGARVAQSNSVILGRVPGYPSTNLTQDKVGIGTIKPTETLDVVGTARVSSLANTENKIVTADTNGKLGLLSVTELNSPKAFLNTTGTADTSAGTTKSVTIYEGPCFSTADPASSCTLKLTHYSSCGGFNQPMTTDIVVVNGINTSNGNFLGTWKANYIDNKGYVSIASSTSTAQPVAPVTPVITYGTNTARYAGGNDFAGGRCFADIKTTINADGTIKVESAKQYMYAHLVYLLSIDKSKSL